MQPNSPMPSGEHKKVGPIIAILVIVLVLIVAALYMFASKINKSTPVPQQPVTSVVEQASNTAAATQSVQPVTNTADDIESIQKDLNSSTNGLDSQNF